MDTKKIITLFLAGVLSLGLVLISSTPKVQEPRQVYRVYLKGKSLGLIESKENLENYIDEAQKTLKEKYDVKKVYAPVDLDVEQEITYDEKISTTENIYNRIQETSPFTIKGYSITIKGLEEKTEGEETKTQEDKVIYVLDKEIFNKAVENTIYAFIDQEKYEDYQNGTQEEIKETGRKVEDIYIDNKIIIREVNIPVTETICQTEEDLSKFLLFGTLKDQKKYVVKEGDTISKVAYDNQLSNAEFLVSNPQFKDENSLLFPGQEVTLGVLQPQFDLVEVDKVVELQEVKYQTEIRYDNNLLLGTTNVIQKGQNGLSRVARTDKYVNGAFEATMTIREETEEIRPAVNEIVVRGGHAGGYAADGYWYWPTKTPYQITSDIGWRWGAFHNGIDIAGTGYGSPVYAANNGTAVEVGYRSLDGNYIVIDHGTGYYTLYAHLSAHYIQRGQVVERGQVIGAVGNSGWATGPHLHFSLFKGYPYKSGYVVLDPRTLY